MKNSKKWTHFIYLAIFVFYFNSSWAGSLVRYKLDVNLKPTSHNIKVNAQLTLPEKLCTQKSFTFKLHKGLNPTSLKSTIQITKIKEISESIPKEIFEVQFVTHDCEIPLSYEGSIDHPPQSEYSPGTISEKGVFLGASTAWYPVIENQLVTFDLEVKTPLSWYSVSQGILKSETQTPKNSLQKWEISKPQDDIYLVSAPFTIYRESHDGLLIEAYLRTPDPDLAQKYISATRNYLKLYSDLLGAYPYQKFSLVENFWATGYGMPSFTLLGSQIIRLPFILYTSYPHEILHNWWGNGVYVNYNTGNWAEGLTSYLADHFFKDQRKQGYDYRRTALNNFASYVSEDNDFPLKDFLGRHDEASSAIGYGKAMMFFHMLKVQLGAEVFFNSLKHFYKNQLFKVSGYEDILNSFELTSNENLKPIFKQWVEHKGAPQLEIKIVSHENAKIKLKLSQTHTKGPVYKLFVPYLLEFKNAPSQRGILNLSDKDKLCILSYKTGLQPKALKIDSKFDVFRHLYREEVPPTLSEVYGEKDSLTLILPSNSPQLPKYQNLAELLKSRFDSQTLNTQVVLDKELSHFPNSKAVWIFGWENLLKDQLKCLFQKAGSQWTPQSLKFNEANYLPQTHNILASLNERLGSKVKCISELSIDKNQKITWLGLTESSDENVFFNKIFHYGSYSIIGFDKELTNVLKTQWITESSPLNYEF